MLHDDVRHIFDGYSLYRHQREAIELGVAGTDFVVTSGTGSGKSLTYIGTIFNHLLANPDTAGVAAIIVYPALTPLCQDTRSGGLDELLASAKIGHDSLVDLASEKTFQAPDDLPFGSAVRRAACDVINGRLMVPHADDDGAIKGGVGVAVAAPIEPVPAGGHPGRGRERTRTAELREGGFRTNPVGIVAEDDQQFGRGVGAHPEAFTEGR